MRQDTANLNLESPERFNSKAALVRAEKKERRRVLGVDNAGRPIEYWGRLRDFWLGYFGKAGANVRSYSVLRELRNPEI
jgi:hypothetical protein